MTDAQVTMPWYESFFDDRYVDFYPSLKQHPVADEEAGEIARLLSLEAGEQVLDLGCGTGRHSVALARRGLAVTGLDLSAHLLARGLAAAESSFVDVAWLQRDMRDLDDLGPFDACVSLYTAFGFFGPEEDQEVLYQVVAALRPGGRFLLDVTNFLGYLRSFPPEVWHESEDAVHRERNTYDPDSGVLITQRRCFFKDGGILELPDSRVQAYMPHELRRMLRRAGFQVEQVHGALDGSPFSWADSPNQVYICRKG